MSEEALSDPPPTKKLPEQIQQEQRHLEEKEQKIQALCDTKSQISREKTRSPSSHVPISSAFTRNSSPAKIVPPPPPPGPPPPQKTTRSKSNPRRSSISPHHKRISMQTTKSEPGKSHHGDISKLNFTSNNNSSNKTKPHLKTTTKRFAAESQRNNSPHRHKSVTNSTIRKQSNYQYAMHEFKQTIEHSLSNDDGMNPGPRSPSGRTGLSSGVRAGGATSHGIYARNRNIRDVTAGVHHHRLQNAGGMSILRMQQGLKSNAANIVLNNKVYPGNSNYTVDSYFPPITPDISAPAKNPGDEFSTAAALAVPSVSNSSISDTPNTSSTMNSNDSIKSNNDETKAMHENLDTLNESELHLKLHADKLTEVERNDGNSPYNHYPSQTNNNHLNDAVTTVTSSDSNEISQIQSHDHDGNMSIPFGDMKAEISEEMIEENSYHRRYYKRTIENTVMPDTTYEERYGDAYVGKPIKYIYPSGYQSMRPRGGPWKLSLAIFFFFTWLCVFIVGHCSDQVDMADYGEEDANFDDDELIMETRWCGSKTLYSMWVVTVLITALAASYCSIIGYIKMRDFSVANGRSQPPGMVGKSEYYVKIDDHHHDFDKYSSSKSSSLKNRNISIYQSDGTPQFWGGHIYKPTQAAVAVTSR